MSREDLAAIVSEEVSTAAAALGMPAQSVIDLALQVTDRIRFRIGGSDLKYVGKQDRKGRAERIRADFPEYLRQYGSADAITALAKREGITPRRVRQILAVK